MPDVTVLVVLAEGFEEIEAVTPIDLLRRAGARVTTAALGPGIHVTGRSGITLHADSPLASVEATPFDCILLPGGPAVSVLRADPRVASLLRLQHSAERWVAAICAAPVVLKDAGILEGHRYTAHFSVAGELTQIIADQRVVIDRHVITSRGAGTALEFGIALVTALFSNEAALSLELAICAG